MHVPEGRVNYEPNSLDQGVPRENPERGLVHFPEPTEGIKVRERAKSFADHYSQARLFFRSITKPEQTHVISAFAFELAKVQTKAIRSRMLGHLALIDAELQNGVERALGMQGQADKITPAVTPRDLPLSPALSILGNAKATLKGRIIGVLLMDGFDPALLKGLTEKAKIEHADLFLLATSVDGVLESKGRKVDVHGALGGHPSVLFDSVVLLATDNGDQSLVMDAATTDWVQKAYIHLKVIAHTKAVQPQLERAHILTNQGVFQLSDIGDVDDYINAAKNGRIWDRHLTINGESDEHAIT